MSRNNETDTKTNKKWAVFTYYNPTIRKVNNLFKHNDVGIAFRNTNTLYQLTESKPHTHIQEHNKSGIQGVPRVKVTTSGECSLC